MKLISDDPNVSATKLINFNRYRLYEGQMPASRGKIISAIRFLEKMRGNSQSALIEANDGNTYIVKWLQDLSAPDMVPHEALCTSIYENLGLPVPSWTAIEVSNTFIEANPAMWRQLPDGLVKPVAGLHFASRQVGGSQQQVYEILPSNWFCRIRNRDDFWGAFTVDVWLNNCDCRQALFVENQNTPELSAVFIDHGHTLDSANERIRACFYLDMRIYGMAPVTETLNIWLNRIRENGQDAIAHAFDLFPPEWITPASQRAACWLMERIPALHSSIFPAIFQWFPLEERKPVCSVRPEMHSTDAFMPVKLASF